MANVIDFRRKVGNAGNGAKETLDRYYAGNVYYFYLMKAQDDDTVHPTLSPTDHLLAWLWAEGFKVVPFAPGDLLT